MKIKNLNIFFITSFILILTFSSCQNEEELQIEIPENAINLESPLVDLILQVVVNEEESEEYISCLDFVYPFSISLFNMDTEQAETIVFQNDDELFLFFHYLNTNDLVTILYPITVIVNNNTYVEVENDQELTQYILECVEINPTSLTEVLSTNVWFVNFYFENEMNQTQEFCEFNLNFNEDGQVIATNNADTIQGTWLIDYVDDEMVVLFAFEEGTVFDQLNTTWFVINANHDVVAFEILNDGDELDVFILDRIETEC